MSEEEGRGVGHWLRVWVVASTALFALGLLLQSPQISDGFSAGHFEDVPSGNVFRLYVVGRGAAISYVGVGVFTLVAAIHDRFTR